MSDTANDARALLEEFNRFVDEDMRLIDMLNPDGDVWNDVADARTVPVVNPCTATYALGRPQRVLTPCSLDISHTTPHVIIEEDNAHFEGSLGEPVVAWYDDGIAALYQHGSYSAYDEARDENGSMYESYAGRLAAVLGDLVR